MDEPKKRAVRAGATIAFGDEAGFYLLPSVLLPSVVRTWAKVGQTPVLKTPPKYEHLWVASAVTMEGRLVTQVRASAFNGAGIVGFLKHLLRQIPGQIVLIWDGARIDHCREVKAFLKAGAAARLRLIRLPAYAPELNPDEGVWPDTALPCSCWLKRELGNLCSRDFTELRYELGLAVQRLRRRPQVIQSFFQKAGLET